MCCLLAISKYNRLYNTNGQRQTHRKVRTQSYGPKALSSYGSQVTEDNRSNVNDCYSKVSRRRISMMEFFKRIVKCRIRGIHKISISSGICVRCNYNSNEHH